MDAYTFHELLTQLPDCESLFRLREGTAAAPVEIRYIEGEECEKLRKSFIPPNLPVVEYGSDLGNSQLLIVSAPGAVGKSTLSKSLASERHAVLYDLAAARPVGGASLSGILLNALGGEPADQFAEYLSEGLQFVIIDALDEGRIKVTEDAFLSFLEDIRSRAENSKGICFILLGRTQIAEDAWVVLDGGSSSVLLLSIEPFDRNQANEYINKSVPEERRTSVFEECRKLIFNQLAFSAGVSEVDESREFLHYPPVLDVIIELLREERNLHLLQNDLESQQTGFQNESLDLLRNVINRILNREQEQKLLPSVRSKFGERANQLGGEDWDSLYTPSEQCERILGGVLDTSVSATPDALPDDLRRDYEESVDEWLPTHPFLQGIDRFANSVFQSYLYARALRGDFGDELRERTTAKLSAPENLQARTRLLAEFYLDGDSLTDDATQEIIPEHLGILYDSLLSSETTRSHLRLTIDGRDALEVDTEEYVDQVEGEFEFLTFDADQQLQGEPQVIPFSMRIDQNTQISFARSIRDCNITLPCSIKFGASNTREFEIGPAVYVSAGQLVIASESLKVGGRSKLRPVEVDDSSVILNALSCDWTSLINRPTVYDRDRFFVSWPDANRFPWTEYQSEHPQEVFADDDALHATYIRFKRIATAFRSHGNGTLARTARKIEHHRVLQGKLGEELLACLVDDNVLIRNSGRYHWNSAQADALLGVSWQDLRKWDCPETLQSYLTAFIKENLYLFNAG